MELLDAFRRSTRLDAPPDQIAQAGFAGASSEVPHRAEMERTFGQSFGGVTAHRGEVAQAAAFSLGAQAYALGDQIVFADDDPSKEVVAHELTHVVQQRGGHAPTAVQAKSAVSTSSDNHELEANGVASQVARNEPGGAISEAPRDEIAGLDAWDILNIATGGAAAAREVTKNSPGIRIFNDLTSSIVLAAKYMPDEFKALFPAKDDIAGWWRFIQVTEGLLGAQLAVVILTGAPDPTFATKLAALVLEALIITFLVVMSVQLGVDAIETATKWWDKVNAGEVDAAAQFFAHLVADLIQIIGAIADAVHVATPHAPDAPHGAPERTIGSVEEPVPAGKAQKAIEHGHVNERHVEPKLEEGKKAEPRTEETEKNGLKKDEPKPDEAKKSEPKKDEPKPDEAKKSEPKKHEPKPDEAKKSEPKKDEPKPDETAPPRDENGGYDLSNREVKQLRRDASDSPYDGESKTEAATRAKAAQSEIVRRLDGLGICFIAGTMVWTPDGPMPIEMIEVGAYVLAEDVARLGLITKRRVMQVFRGAASALCEITVQDTVITATRNHLFWTAQNGWLRAADLRSGHRVRNSFGEEIEVQSVRDRDLTADVPTFNLHVEGVHTYFVATGVLVHNDNPNWDNKTLWWYFGNKVNGRTTDIDGISLWKTGSTKDVEDMFRIRKGIDARPSKDPHQAYTQEELASKGVIVVEPTPGNGPMTGRLVHGSARPADAPSGDLDKEAIDKVAAGINRATPAAKATPKDFGC